MKTLQLNIDNSLYDTLLAMLKILPKDKIEIIEKNRTINNEDLNQYAGTVRCFKTIKDPVAWQQNRRSEWDREY